MSDVKVVPYRGYAIVVNDLGADVWKVDKWIAVERSMESAKTLIDSLVDD